MASAATLLKSFLLRRDRVPMPYIFQCFGQGLLFHGAVGVPGITRKYELIMVALGGKNFGHVLVGQDPIVHSVSHDRAEVISIADFHPETYRLHRAIGNKVFVEFHAPCGV